MSADKGLKKGSLAMPETSEGLPWAFDIDQVTKSRDNKCALCQRSFRKVTDFKIFAASHHNCNKCGISVCEKCSLHKVQLSQKDTQKYRVCNKCHTQIEN